MLSLFSWFCLKLKVISCVTCMIWWETLLLSVNCHEVAWNFIFYIWKAIASVLSWSYYNNIYHWNESVMVEEESGWFKISLDMLIGMVLGMASSPLMMKGIALLRRRRKLDKILHEIAEMRKKIISPYKEFKLYIEDKFLKT